MIILFTLITLLPSLILSYNLDVNYPLIYTDPTKNTSSNATQDELGSYFGYSVLLISEYDKFESQLIIGAPRGSYSGLEKSVKEPGITYECSLSGKCRPISPISDSSPEIAVKQIGMYAKVIQDNGWFGMSLAAIHPTLLKICAPHTKIVLFKPFTNEYKETMQGICYFYYKSIDKSFLQMETESLTTYNFSSFHWHNPQYGFSQNVATGISLNTKLNMQEKSESIIKSLLKNTSMIVGNPTNQISGSVNIIQANKRKTLQILNDDGHEQAEFGYSVTSGHFFRKNKMLFASGAPAWKFMGKVGIIDSTTEDPVIVMFLNGHQLGEYFGASLTSGDINNDGFDDLIVGAPHYGDDNGKVYIYLGSQDGFLDYNPVIEGTIEGAQFGYSLSCGDLDRDGFSDLIVGAPWEQSGVIYIYNGYSVLGEENTLNVSQRIAAVEISTKLQGFGFSISNLVDVDSNGFVDVAVGAHKSSHAVILRTKPVEKTDINLKMQPNILKKGIQRVSPEICLKNYKSINSQIVKNYTLTVVVDAKYKRFTYDYIVWNIPVTEKTYQVFQYRYSSQQKTSRLTNPHWNGCTTSHFNVKSDINNFIDPLDITLTYELKSYPIKPTKNYTNDNFCKLCPIKYIGRESQTIKLSIPFEIDCGEDKVCSSNISVTTFFNGAGNDSTWEIGSGDVSLEVKFKNQGEPANSVTTEFFIPKGIHLMTLLPFCQEEMSENALIVTCTIDTPLYKGVQKILKLDLNMQHFETHNLINVEQEKLFINVTIKSSTDNLGVKEISVPLFLRRNVSTSITGKTNKDSVNLTSVEQKDSNITFQHIYNVFKQGSTPIRDGKITIQIPTRLCSNEPFIMLNKPQFQVLASSYDCVTNDIPLQSPTYAQTAKSLSNFNNNSKNEEISEIPREEKRQSVNIAVNRLKLADSQQNLHENLENNIIYVDCLNDKIECGTVTCDLAPLKSPQDIGIIVLNLTIKLEAVRRTFNVGTILEFSTNARINVENLMNTTEVQVLTTIYNVKEIIRRNQSNVWIILIFVTIGIIILSVIMAILYYVGLFRRKRKFVLNFVNVNENNVL